MSFQNCGAFKTENILNSTNTEAGNNSSSIVDDTAPGVPVQSTLANVKEHSPLVVGPNDHVALLSYSVWFGGVMGVPVLSRQVSAQPLPEAHFFPLRTSSFPWEPTPRWIPQYTNPETYAPDLKAGYHSADPAIIAAHYNEILGMGFDAIVVDITNGLKIGFAKPPEDFISKSINANTNNISGHETFNINTVAVYEGMNQLGAKLKIVPSVGAQCDGDSDTATVDERCSTFSNVPGDPYGRSYVQRGLDFFIKLQEKFPNLTVIYEGKPLILTFSGPVLFSEANKRLNQIMNERYYVDIYRGEIRKRLYRDVITLRQKGGVLQQIGEFTAPSVRYPPLQFSTQGMWSYYDRWSPSMNWYPSFATIDKNNENSRVEAFAASMGSWGDRNHQDSVNVYGASTEIDKINLLNWGWWNSATRGNKPEINPTAVPRHGGATFREEMRWARILKPTFLIVTRYNEFSYGSDDGWSEETSMNIEPTRGPAGYGSKYVNIVRDEIKKYVEVLEGKRAERVGSSDFKIIGTVDSVARLSNGVYEVSGWACARGFEVPVQVEILIGSQLIKIGSLKTTLNSENLINRLCLTENTNHRFKFEISSSVLSQFAGQSISVRGLAPHGLGSANELLEQSGQFLIPQLTCNPDIKPQDTNETVSCNSLYGAKYTGSVIRSTTYSCQGVNWVASTVTQPVSNCIRICEGSAPATSQITLNCETRDSTKTGTYTQQTTYACSTTDYTWKANVTDTFNNCQAKIVPPEMSWNVAKSNEELWPAADTLDSLPATCYSSNQFSSSANDRNVFLAAWLNSKADGAWSVSKLELTSRMLNGTAIGFPHEYEVFLTSEDNSSWVSVGKYSNQPGVDGLVRINFASTLKTWGVMIVPTSLGVDDNGNYYFQICGVKF